MKYFILTTAAFAIKCWSNGTGNEEPFKYELDIKGEYCIRQVQNGNEYYTVATSEQLATIQKQFESAPVGWVYGLVSCQTDFCNSPDVSVTLTTVTAPSATASAENSDSTNSASPTGTGVETVSQATVTSSGTNEIKTKSATTSARPTSTADSNSSEKVGMQMGSIALLVLSLI